MNWPSGPTAARTNCWKRLWTISWPTTIGLEARFETAWRQPVEARQFPTKRCAHGSNRKTAPEGCASTGRTVLSRICDRSRIHGACGSCRIEVVRGASTILANLSSVRFLILSFYQIFEERLLILNIVHGAQRWP